MFKSNHQGGLPPGLGSYNPQTLRVEARVEMGGSTREEKIGLLKAETGSKAPSTKVSNIPLSGQCKELVLWPSVGQNPPLLVAWQGLRFQDALSASIAHTGLVLLGAPQRSSCSCPLPAPPLQGVVWSLCLLPTLVKKGPEASSVATPCSVTNFSLEGLDHQG